MSWPSPWSGWATGGLRSKCWRLAGRRGTTLMRSVRHQRTQLCTTRTFFGGNFAARGHHWGLVPPAGDLCVCIVQRASVPPAGDLRVCIVQRGYEARSDFGEELWPVSAWRDTSVQCRALRIVHIDVVYFHFPRFWCHQGSYNKFFLNFIFMAIYQLIIIQTG